ncbi:MAG: DUF2321 domain-containing protein [Nitrososphaera sp.]|jgi:hypothetical protein
MGEYDTAQICLNGHTVNSTAHAAPERNEEFCSKCGQKTLTACPACGTCIRGLHRSDNNSFEFSFPNYCFKCGTSFPWTQRKISAIGELVDAMSELADAEKDDIKSRLPDIIFDNPGTEAASIAVKQALSKMGKEGRLVAEEKILDLASENAKKIIFEGLWA